jgi:DNA-binding NarL/FixJ family response regulator
VVTLAVLVVDTHEPFAASLADALESMAGLDIDLVVGVADAASALAAAQAGADVAIVDVTHDGGDSLALIRRLCDEVPGVSVVGMSASWGATLRQAMLDAGASEVVDKCADVDDILGAIRRASRSRLRPGAEQP